MSKPKAPKAPDPAQTAAAQTGTNISTAVANSLLNNFDQVTPDGLLTFTTDGYETITDLSTGRSYEIPRRTATTTLSPEQQAIADQNNAAELNLAGLANQQSGFLQDYMAQPFSYDVGEYENWAGGLYDSLNRNNAARAEEDLRTRLVNKGLREGTELFDREMANLRESQGNNRNRFMLDAYNTGMNTALTERNQPINEITALLSGSQVSQPNFVNPSQSNIATTDYAGLVNSSYGQQMAAHNSAMNNWNGLWGAGLGAGAKILAAGPGSLATTMLSDERAKKDKERVGSYKGMGLYEYRYKGAPKGSPKQTGMMAQEVARKRPEAVHKRPDGLYAVDYAEAMR